MLRVIFIYAIIIMVIRTALNRKKEGIFFVKTAIIQTSIWKDKKIRQMHIDTKLVFLCLITNPDRNCTRYLKLDEDYLCIQSGVDYRQLEVIKKQLAELEVIYFIDDWAIFTDDSYAKPSKGKLSQAIFEKDLLAVPEHVKNYYDNSSKSLMSRSCAAQEYKDKDINKDKYIDKTVDKNKSKTEINEMFEAWNEIVGYEISANKQKNRYACNNLLKKYGKEKLTQLLNGVLLAQSDKFAPRISDFATLQSKLNELLLWGKRKGTNQTKGVIRI